MMDLMRAKCGGVHFYLSLLIFEKKINRDRKGIIGEKKLFVIFYFISF